MKTIRTDKSPERQRQSIPNLLQLCCFLCTPWSTVRFTQPAQRREPLHWQTFTTHSTIVILHMFQKVQLILSLCFCFSAGIEVYEAKFSRDCRNIYSTVWCKSMCSCGFIFQLGGTCGSNLNLWECFVCVFFLWCRKKLEIYLRCLCFLHRDAQRCQKCRIYDSLCTTSEKSTSKAFSYLFLTWQKRIRCFTGDKPP